MIGINKQRLSVMEKRSGGLDFRGTTTIHGDVAGRDIIKGDRHVHYYQTAPKPTIPILPYEPETVLIPAGAFVMGDDEMSFAQPQHVVELAAFRIGRFPITQRQYATFLRKTGGAATPELNWYGNQPPKGSERMPVSGVTWYEAVAYCEWLSEQSGRTYQLPSEAQWEKSARGTEGNRFPWGDEMQPQRCNTDLKQITPIDAFPAQSPYGCYDMVGNVREWCSTLWGSSPREPDPHLRYPWADDGRDDLTAAWTTRRVFRGGRGREETALYCSNRDSYLPNRAGPRINRHGFRVVLLL